MVRTSLFVAAIVLFVSATPAANLIIPTEFREVVQESALILRGVVTDVRPVEVPGRGIDSIATVAIDAVMKGDADRFVSVRVPGGEIGRRRFVVVGAPTFSRGQRAVWFLKRDDEGFWRPVGLSLGVYRVRADVRTGRAVVAPPLVAGVTAAAAGRVIRGDLRRRSLPVDEFESLVGLVVAGKSLPGIPDRPARPRR